MNRRRITTRSALAVLAAAALTLAASAALAAVVTVYSNDFSSEGKFRQIARTGGGKRCDKKYRHKSKVMLASVKKSPTTCGYRVPVQGDDELPNQQVAVEGKILKETPKSVRDSAFIEATVRAGGKGSGYSLRIFPQRKRFELNRGPDGGGNFPVRGKSDAIKKVNERNKVTVIARGAEIRGVVNGKEVAKANDTNPGQVRGTKVRFALGSKAKKDKPVIGTFKRVAVSVPAP